MPFSSKEIVYGTEMALHSSKKALQYASKAAWEHCLYQKLGRFGTLHSRLRFLAVRVELVFLFSHYGVI